MVADVPASRVLQLMTASSQMTAGSSRRVGPCETWAGHIYDNNAFTAMSALWTQVVAKIVEQHNRPHRPCDNNDDDDA